MGQLLPGSHTLKLVVDSTFQIAESDESDNTFTKTVVIPGAPQEVTISVTNQLLYSVSITANGSAFGSVAAGETMTPLLGPLASFCTFLGPESSHR